MNPDHDAIRASAQALLDDQKVPVRAVSVAFVHEDGTIMATGGCGEDETPPEGLMMIEGIYDQKTQRFDTAGVARAQSASASASNNNLLPPGAYPVVDQVEMPLTATPSVPADGTTIATISGVPVRSRFYMSEENRATPVDDGEVTLTFDTPGTYTFTFIHQGWLDTVVVIEALSSP